MRALFFLLALAATLTACDSNEPDHPADRCPAPWLPDACPPEDRVPWKSD